MGQMSATEDRTHEEDLEEIDAVQQLVRPVGTPPARPPPPPPVASGAAAGDAADAAAAEAEEDTSEWATVCDSRDVGKQPVRHTLRDDTDIVLVRRGGRLFAMSNRCPHKAASLHRSGDIEDLGGDLGLCLRCPKHKSKFGGGLFVSFATGKCTTRSPCSRSETVAAWAVPVYETKEHGGAISVRPQRPRAEQPTAPAAVRQTSLAAQVVRILSVSPDSHEFTLQLLGKQDRAAFARELAAMWHIWLTVGDVSREYTPTSSCGETASTGTITLIIKLYARGSMSEQLAKATTGDVVAVSPPRVTLRVPALLEEASLPRGTAFNLLAGGTGIAPCLQLLRRAKARSISVRMLYSCWTHDDVLLAAELEELAACWPNQDFYYTLVLTRETSQRPEQAERQLKRPRSIGTLYGRRIDATIVREYLMGIAKTDGAMSAQPGAAMTVVSGPSGFNACCADAVRHALLPAERGEVVVLDA